MFKEISIQDSMELNGGSWAALAASFVVGGLTGGNPYAMGVTYEVVDHAKDNFEKNWSKSDVDHWTEIHNNSVYAD